MLDVQQAVVGIVAARAAHDVVVQNDSLGIHVEGRRAVVTGAENGGRRSVVVLSGLRGCAPMAFQNAEFFTIPVAGGGFAHAAS